MNTTIPIRRLLSGILAACLFVSLICPAAAAEVPDAILPEPEPSVPETTAASTESTVPSPTDETLSDEEAEPDFIFSAPYNLYFGLLHAHTNISDGVGTVEEAFSHAAQVEGLDFFAVTDHSNSFDNADAGSLTRDGSAISAEWTAGKAAAAAVTTEDFLGLFGFEMTWPEIRQLGHIVTFGTPGWVTRDQEGFANDPKALAQYFEALAAVPDTVSQFCHPGKQYGTFNRFRDYRAGYDERIQLLEVLGEGSLDSYIQALDQYWHLAPTASQNNHNGNWGSENGLRTVILAEELTEKSLFEAIRDHRVYATEDPDLHLCFYLDGHILGSVLSQADNPEITLSLWDPTDTGNCRIEVFTEGGHILTHTEFTGNGDFTFSVPGGFRWYFLRVTQADGDIAVTAPVWVEGFANMGITSLTCGTEIPVQGQPLELELHLFNEERVDFVLTSVELYAGDSLIHREDAPGILSPGSVKAIPFSHTHPDTGTVTLRALVRGTVLDRERAYETSLSLRFRPGTAVTGLLIDGSHENTGLDALSRLKELAREAGMNVTVFTGDMPMGGSLLVIPPLQKLPEDTFLEDVGQFLETGGNLILLAESEDSEYENVLLEAIGSSLRFGDTVLPAGTSTHFNTTAPWCENLSGNQVFLWEESRVLDPDRGSWLVKDASGNQALLSCEQTQWGGTIFAAGSGFLLDSQMPLRPSSWLLPSANQTLLQTVLGTAEPPLEPLCIGEVRRSTPGETYRIKGYVTAGTSNPSNTFPDTIYLQDDTGGIAVTGFSFPNIPIGTSLELIGILREEAGVTSLEYTDHRLCPDRSIHVSPRELSCETAMDYALHGGELVQLTGAVTDLTLTADREGICRLVIEDALGGSAIIEIEEAIRSGTSGENTLAKQVKKGRAIRAIGLLHVNDAGEAVLRVRNCDEVVYIPPKADPTNPKTGDPFWLP